MSPPTLDSGNFGIYEPFPDTQPGTYSADDGNPIPIGATVQLTASSPYGEENPITSWSWSGGSEWGGYFGTPAGEAIPSQSAPPAPNTTGRTYQFIVDPTPQVYDVIVEVTYSYGGDSSAELLFQSDAPTGSISATKPLGSQTWSYVPGEDGGIKVMLNPKINLNFTATTDGYTAGQFALLQIVTNTKQTYTAANTTWYVQNNINYPPNGPNFNGNLIDNGQSGSWDHQFDYNGAQKDSLTVGASQSIPATGVNAPTTSDGPSLTLPNTINGNTVTSVSRSDNFSIYLMYQSDMENSVWIAVSQLNWSWSVSVSQQNYGQPNPTPQPDPGNSSPPSGASAFPTWVNTITAFTNYYAVVNGVPQNWRQGT